MENDIFYEPEDAYWTGIDRLSYESSNLEEEWPVATNPFILRMAQAVTVGRKFHGLSAEEVKALIGTVVMGATEKVHRFIVMPLPSAQSSYSVCLVAQSKRQSPPLLSDNSCAFGLAIEWMRSSQPFIEVSCTVDATFWIRKT